MNDEASIAAKEGNVNNLKELLEKGIDVNAKDKSGRTLLHHATSCDQHEVVKCLLHNGADVLLGTHEGDTVLHTAVAKNDESLVKVILENVPRGKLVRNLLDAKTKTNGTAALHVAAERNYLKLASLLLEYGANFEIKNAVEEKPIDLATNKDLRRLLVLIGESFERATNSDERLGYDLGSVIDGDPSPIFNCRNNDGHTLVQAFIFNFRIDTTSFPFESDGAQCLLHLRVNRSMDRDASALCSLTRRDRIDELIALVHECRRLCFVWPSGDDAMSQFTTMSDTFDLMSRKYFASPAAAMRGLDKVRETLSIYRKMKGSLTADETIRNLDEIFEIFCTDLDERGVAERYNVKLPAKWNGNIATFLNLMLSHAGSLLYISIVSMDDSLASALLFHAVKNGDTCEARRLIVNAPASPHVVDESGRTVLCHAAENDDVNMIKLLLKLRVDPNCENDLPWLFLGKNKLDAKVVDALLNLYGNSNFKRPLSPLYLAVSKGHAKSVEVMLKRIDTEGLAKLIDRRGELGDTALHAAAKLGRLDIAKMLLKHGASYGILDAEGSTPLDVTTNEDVTELLTLVDGCFHDAGDANVELVYKLKAMPIDLFLVVAGARNQDGQTLAVVAGKAGAKNVAGVILKMIRDAAQN